MELADLKTQPEFIVMPFEIGIDGVDGMYQFIEEYAEEKNYTGPIAVYHRATTTERQTKLKWHVEGNGKTRTKPKPKAPAPRKHSRWTDEDLLTMVDMKERGCTDKDIGEKLGRTEKSVGNRWLRWREGDTTGEPTT